MARKNDETSTNAGQNSKVLYILLVLVIGLIGANTWLLMDTRSIAMSAAAGVVEEPKDEAAPVFVNISPFTVNLQSDQFGPRLLYTGLTLEVPGEEVKQRIMTNMPQVRNRLLVLLSGQNAEKISQSAGKKELAATIKANLSAPYTENGEELAINDVLFTEFIVQ